MARVTVEDCLRIIPNRFELSLIAGNRAKAILAGAPVLIDLKKKEKPVVIALREIAANKLDLDEIRENIKRDIKSGRSFTNFDMTLMQNGVDEAVLEDDSGLEDADDDLEDDLDDEPIEIDEEELQDEEDIEIESETSFDSDDISDNEE